MVFVCSRLARPHALAGWAAMLLCVRLGEPWPGPVCCRRPRIASRPCGYMQSARVCTTNLARVHAKGGDGTDRARYPRFAVAYHLRALAGPGRATSGPILTYAELGFPRRRRRPPVAGTVRQVHACTVLGGRVGARTMGASVAYSECALCMYMCMQQQQQKQQQQQQHQHGRRRPMRLRAAVQSTSLDRDSSDAAVAVAGG
ncbi:hypothetical protein CDD83_11003 [Cordyceps sp. RAO-2017]|nr:hypothetical protein CDD83_11003 [Cordyceps sp. RAO-2017]